VLGVVTEADLLLKQEHPDLELNVPLTWSRRRRLEREKAAAVVAGERLPVVDDAGRLVGIVSRADLLRVFIRTDEA
jgi:CBS-domain-containing membrane protein